MQDIANQVVTFIQRQLLLDSRIEVARVPSFLEAGVLDSTGVLELVQHLEDTYGIVVRDDEMVPDNLDSLDKVVRFVQRKTA